MNTSDTLLLSTQISHLTPRIWEIVNRNLIRKAISEFTHELLLELEFIGQKEDWKIYKMYTDIPDIVYYFNVKKRVLDHSHIDRSSIIKMKNDKEVELDALDFILELKNTLGIPDDMLPTYMEEITSTLHGAAYKYKYQEYNASELIAADFQDIEKAMTEGHPCFVANNGRIGFNTSQYHHFAPETETSFALVWIAGHKTKADYHSVSMHAYDVLIENELGKETVQLFNQKLMDLDLDPEDYIFMPVHPWQWDTKISTIFAQDIAQQFIVLLGKGNDQYAAQQSIRTLFNITHPEKLYTKTALSILNMGFMRGLSPYYMGSTPVITDWISQLLEHDTLIRQTGFTMLGEIATVGYRNRYYETLGKTKAHNKMLSALWRESPFSKVTKDQKLMTMAAFLHLDNQGNSLVVELIKASSVSVEVWLENYLRVYLTPLLHCLFQYDLVFMPHGENLIMVIENSIPVKAIMKDITEEIAIFDETITLPEKAKRLHVKADDDIKALAIFTDVFDCFFRFLSDILVTQGDYSETTFWKQVAQCVINYQESHSELSDKFQRIDLFAPEFKRCCLNRLQLLNTKHMLNLADPVDSLQFKGTIKNPIATYKTDTKNTKTNTSYATAK
ncbi:IucA/IucC family protein [Aquimarina mytili]|uniref:IucA/IucC family siderophore biosynthesis protein n=1 Tax=Aquimarina mytili TaxID=874423 RepID=A0A937D9C9_9FLAO|nr:IucA/IucC family siderophore biosynthesis protein [Aquimarina mytili]MBL0682378.1 IucA/IucC family siderophore biosynthesis protein [Aquimarina mytili]